MKTLSNQQNILDLLKKLSGLDPLKKLFWTELNYKRINKPLSRRSWSEKTATALADDPLLLAAGGADDDFHVIYAKLDSDKLLLTQERAIVANLLKEHPYALFVISSREQELWHFINVKYGRDAEKRRQFRRITVGKDERLRTASERISMLDLASIADELFGISPLAVQERHDEAFDVEAITKVFYDEYEAVFNILQDDLGKKTKDKKWAHDYALQFLNRCMFLYFIQRKGWLAKDREFLRTYWEAYNNASTLKDSFVEKWLNVLFFDAFNNKFHGGHRHLPKALTESLSLFPYLNGGLFSPNKDLDNRYEARISDKRFEQIFNFFEQYNFTIAEDSPLDKEVAVDPEMIGKVYESLINVEEIAPDQRSAAGIFYTPRIEIDLMCRLALVDNLANHLGGAHKSLLNQLVFAYEPDEKAEADAAFHNPKLWPDLLKHLNEITIVDPACGSGSFLVGMLYVLDDLYRRAERQHGKEENSFKRKKRIIGQSLYGVDVMDWACHVAELRLWLALIIDADFTQEELHFRYEALLPNFSFNIRCGDSLVQELGGIALRNLHSIKGTAPIISSQIKSKINKLRSEKIKFYKNEPTREFMTLSDAKKSELHLLWEILDDRNKKMARELGEKKKLIEKPIGRQIRLDGKIEDISIQQELDFRGISRQIELLTEELGEITEAKAALGSIQDIPFVWEIAFIEIFGGDKKGFDIVLGNPPYVRQENIADPALAREEINKENKKTYKSKLARSVYQQFPNFFGYKAGNDAVIHRIDAKSDLYIYFYFNGLSLLNSKGSFCFITSNSWLDVGYGKDLQEFLLKHTHINLILDNQAKRSFAQADINTVIVLFSSPDERNRWGLEKTAKFVMFKVPFENVLSPIIFDEIDVAGEARTTLEYRLIPVNQKVLFEQGQLNSSGLKEDITGKESEVSDKDYLITNPNYGGNKLGSRYLRAPDIYHKLLGQIEPMILPITSVARIQYGLKTGLTEFFYVDDEKKEKWSIEPEFLMPFITSTHEVTRYILQPENSRVKLFLCKEIKSDLREQNKRGALSYIEWGESQKTDKGAKHTIAGVKFPFVPSVKGNSPWHNISIRNTGDFIMSALVRERYFYAANPENVFVSNMFYQGLLIKKAHKLPVWMALNSTITYFFQEILGRPNIGGRLNFYAPEFTQIYLPKPFHLIKHIGAAQIEKAFDLLSKTKIMPIFEEVNKPERKMVDDLIRSSLRISANLWSEICLTLLEMVEKRTSKEKSL